jgi:hypothetical protein
MKDNLKVGNLSNFMKWLDPGQARVQIPAQAGLEKVILNPTDFYQFKDTIHLFNPNWPTLIKRHSGGKWCKSV